MNALGILRTCASHQQYPRHVLDATMKWLHALPPEFGESSVPLEYEALSRRMVHQVSLGHACRDDANSA